MTDTPFHSLNDKERLGVLGVAATRSGIQAYLIEKDIWVVQTLSALFAAPFGRDLTFKGGTSLSKAYKAIDRFSEDIDITYDIHAIAPGKAPSNDADLSAMSRNQAKKLSDEILKLLECWVNGIAIHALHDGLTKAGVEAQLEVDKDCVYVVYEPLSPSGGDFVQPRVKVEFGARSTGEPHQDVQIDCDAADWVQGVSFPTVAAQVMLAERTFWEKATAVHVFCKKNRLSGDRQSRHWYDLVRLDDKGYANRALKDNDIAVAVARNKDTFFRAGANIDCAKAVAGNLQLVPSDEFCVRLKDDYCKMLESGIILPRDETFEDLMQRCDDLQTRANNRPGVEAVRAVLSP